MQDIPLQLNVIALIILLGLFLGALVSFFLIKKSIRSKAPNLFMGMLIFSLTLIMFEGWINYTGFIFKVLWLTNFSEPLNFILAPLTFLFMSRQLGDEPAKTDYWHFIPFLFWLGYSMLFFLEPEAMKYNDNINVMQLDIPKIDTSFVFYNNDPLNIRWFVNIATISHVIIYLSALGIKLFNKTKDMGEHFFSASNKTLVDLRYTFYHFVFFVFLFLAVKLNFKNDVGDYFIFLYLSYMIFVTAMQIMNGSKYFDKDSTFLQTPVLKYKKSSLIDDHKIRILEAVRHQMKQEKYFKKSSASLTDLASTLKESSHHVSQVINEKLNQSFFELLANYRIEEAKTILRTEIGKKLTIEEVAEQVGYNSKSAFNTAFKKITLQTPSEYRDS